MNPHSSMYVNIKLVLCYSRFFVILLQ